MKTLKSIQFMVILLSTSLIMACGLGAAPNANPSAPAVAPVATNNSQSSGANSIPAIAGNCTLLSKDEVGKVLAQAVDEVRDPSPNHTLCVYQTKNLILELGFNTKFGGFGDSVSQDELRRYWSPISPASFLERFAGRDLKSLLLWARHDSSFLPVYSRGVLDAFRELGLPHEVVTLPCGHYTTGQFPFKLMDGIAMCRFAARNL